MPRIAFLAVVLVDGVWVTGTRDLSPRVALHSFSFVSFYVITRAWTVNDEEETRIMIHVDSNQKMSSSKRGHSLHVPNLFIF